MTSPATSRHALPVRVSSHDDLERIIEQAAPDCALAAHARAVAETVEGLGVGEEATLAAGLYPLWRHQRIAPDTTADSRQKRLQDLLQGVDRLAVIDELAAQGGEAKAHERAERLRQMLLALVEDARVVVIKLADHLEGLREAKAFPREEQIRVAQETFDIYAPLANRLGIWQLKWQLEDLALRFLEPQTYHQIASWLAERRSERERRIGAIVDQLQRDLRTHGIDAEVTGRPKNIFSIWQKVRSKNLSFESVFDVRALRVVVPDVASCYAVVGIIHRRWPPVPGQFDDYIANPKENLYQSLHTAVIGPDGNTLEVQIRTREMHEHAELGIAAHWRYKEGSTSDRGIERKIRWLRTLLEAPEGETSDDLLERFRSEILAEHVYVLTPQGEVIDLPRGATPVDFAYAIHTEVGHRCRGARVNGRIASLARPLESGDRVEILTARDGGPSRDWLVPQLGYLGTARARERVRQWFRQQPRDEAVTSGRALLQRELQRLGLPDASYDELAEELGYGEVEEFLAAIGRGDVTIDQVTARLRALRGPAEGGPDATPAGATTFGRQSADIEVEGAGNMLPTVARCCRPAPPDEIVGYITRSRGVTVHRSDCRNALRLAGQAPERMIEVSWGRAPSQRYAVDIRVRAHDRSGLLRDITQVMTNEGINLLGASTRTDPTSRVAVMDLTCEITDIPQLSRVLNRVSQLPNIQAAHRRV